MLGSVQRSGLNLSRILSEDHSGAFKSRLGIPKLPCKFVGVLIFVEQVGYLLDQQKTTRRIVLLHRYPHEQSLHTATAAC